MRNEQHFTHRTPPTHVTIHKHMTVEAFCRDVTHRLWLETLGKRNLDAEISLFEFAEIVLLPNTQLTPLFRHHFTWMTKDMLVAS